MLLLVTTLDDIARLYGDHTRPLHSVPTQLVSGQCISCVTTCSLATHIIPAGLSAIMPMSGARLLQVGYACALAVRLNPGRLTRPTASQEERAVWR